MMKILAYLLFAYLYTSVFVFIYILIRAPQKLDYNKPETPNPLLYAVLIGTLIALWSVLTAGLQKFLFIPYSWGWNDNEGVWTSARWNLSWILALVVSVYIMWLIGELQRKERVIKELQARYQKLKGQ